MSPDTVNERTRTERTASVGAAVVALAAAVAFVARGIPRLRDASFFAEDGQIFFAGAYNDGLTAIVDPYAGYLHLVPRLVAAAFAWAPIHQLPTLYAAATIVIHLLMLTPALSRRLSWILPSPWHRAGLFATLCVMPGLWEVYGNVANLIFAAGTTLVLLVLSRDPATRGGRWAEAIAIIVIGLSGPLTVIFLPLFAWRWWRNGRTAHSLRVTVLATGAAAIQLAVYLTSDRSTPGGGTLVLLAKTAGERVGGGWIAGDRNVFVGMPTPWLTAAAYLWFALVVMLTVWRFPRIALAPWALAGVLLFAAVDAYGPGMVGSSQAFQRHLLTPLVVCAILLWIVVASDRRPWCRALAVLLLAAGIGGAVHDFAPEPYPLRPDLTELRTCADQGDTVCTQPIFGPGWAVVLQPR